MTDASGLAVGDDVLVGWTITDAFVAEHGMTGTWQAFNGTWQAFFRREVVAVDTTVDAAPRAPRRAAALRRPGAGRRRACASRRARSTEVGVFDLGTRQRRRLGRGVGERSACTCWALVGVQDAFVQGRAVVRARAATRATTCRTAGSSCRAPSGSRSRTAGWSARRTAAAAAAATCSRSCSASEVLTRDCVGGGGPPQLHPELGLRHDGLRVAAVPHGRGLRRVDAGAALRRPARPLRVPPLPRHGEPGRRVPRGRRVGGAEPPRLEQRRRAHGDGVRVLERRRRRASSARASTAGAT